MGQNKRKGIEVTAADPPPPPPPIMGVYCTCKTLKKNTRWCVTST